MSRNKPYNDLPALLLTSKDRHSSGTPCWPSCARRSSDKRFTVQWTTRLIVCHRRSILWIFLFASFCSINFILSRPWADLLVSVGIGRNSQSKASCCNERQHRVCVHEGIGRRCHFEWTRLGETVSSTESIKDTFTNFTKLLMLCLTVKEP